VETVSASTNRPNEYRLNYTTGRGIATAGITKYDNDWQKYIGSPFDDSDDGSGEEEEDEEGNESDSEEEEEEEEDERDAKGRARDGALWNDADLVAKENFTAFALVMNSGEAVAKVGEGSAKHFPLLLGEGKRQRMLEQSKRNMQVSPAIMQMVVSGTCKELSTVLAAEGQVVRLLYQSETPMETLAFLECWLCVISQVVDGSELGELVGLYGNLADDAMNGMRSGAADEDVESYRRAAKELLVSLIDVARQPLSGVVYGLAPEHKFPLMRKA
jgi:hypothetical protein